MCLGIAGQIVEMLQEPKDLARVNVFGTDRTINIGLVEKDGVAVGDWVLIHVGFAIAKMDEEEARASMAFMKGMAEAHIKEYNGEADELALSGLGVQDKGKNEL